MKYKNIIPLFIAFVGLNLISCDDEKMEWYKDPSHGDVTVSELPLPLAEKITRYDALKTYASFPLGIGVGMEEYMDNEAYRAIVEENFDEITIGYAMKHGPMVDSKGEINFTKVDALMERLQSVGLGLYGHTLVWHQNQNASYLNGLIAPIVIPGPAGENELANGSFEEGIGAWGSWGNKDLVDVTDEQAIDGEKSLKVVVNSSASAVYSVQIQSPSIPLVEGHHYQISFFIKSDIPGAVRMSFDNQLDKAPLGDNFWPANTASDGTDNTISTSTTWKQIIYDKETSNTFVANAASGQFRLDLGLKPNVTYYIDNVVVVDLDAEPTVVNLLSNGDFETGTKNPWGSWGNGSSSDISADGEGYGDKGFAMVLVNPTDADSYSAQAAYEFNLKRDGFEYLTEGKMYKVTAMIKSSVPGGSIQMQIQNKDYGGQYSGGQTVGTAWIPFEWEFTPSTNDRNKLLFDFGAKAATYYIDNVILQEIGTTEKVEARAAIIIEKTDEEKAEIIGEAMETWISQMVGHCKVLVKAWDVVNEPMDDGKPSALKTGIGKTDMADDEFYWQDYLGKDYAVTAFNLARQHGNPDDKLFINDYNLEYNLAKCDGLIEYVKYIESKGAKVDGIGTQMHIAIDSNKDNIEQMFQKLGATGKLIKITELDIKVNTASPTTAQLAEQAEMYRYVMEMYIKHVPEAQRHSVTIWGLSDDPAEHEHWIPDDAPNLWNKDYNRKHAYKGVADGLAGRDVSEDFSGELEY